MLVRDLRESKSQIVNIDLVALRPSKLRMEVTSSLGMHLASFVLNDGRMKYLLPRDKKYIEGVANTQSMRAVIGIDLDPRLLMNLIFDEAPTEKVWTCTRDEKGYLALCANKKDQVKIAWADRDASRKKISMESPNYQMQFSLYDFSTKVEDAPDLFNISPPPGYMTQKVGAN